MLHVAVVLFIVFLKTEMALTETCQFVSTQNVSLVPTDSLPRPLRESVDETIHVCVIVDIVC